MLRKKQTSSSGFTIVELLIVIVVIAILATISILAYQGIQKRARDTAINAELHAWYKIVQNYRINNSGQALYASGEHDNSTGSSRLCLSRQNLPAISVFPENVCERVYYTDYVNWSIYSSAIVQRLVAGGSLPGNGMDKVHSMYITLALHYTRGIQLLDANNPSANWTLVYRTSYNSNCASGYTESKYNVQNFDIGNNFHNEGQYTKCEAVIANPG